MSIRLARPLAALALLLPIASALAAEPPTLLGAAGYPAHSCGNKPLPPMAPLGAESPSLISMYNDQVRSYNERAKTYTDCIQAYLDSANADINRIQARAQAAVSEANAR